MSTIKFIVKIIAPKIKVIENQNEKTGYCFYDKTLTIGYDFFQQELSYGFLRHLTFNHKCNFTTKFKPKFWIILHELGHYNTQTSINQEEIAQRIIYSMLKQEILINNPVLENQYFDLPSEWNATEWAINWIKKHKILASVCNIFM